MGGTKFEDAAPAAEVSSKPMVKMLVCSCGDCDSWIVAQKGAKTVLLCQTCGKEVDLGFQPEIKAEGTSYVERELKLGVANQVNPA